MIITYEFNILEIKISSHDQLNVFPYGGELHLVFLHVLCNLLVCYSLLEPVIGQDHSSLIHSALNQQVIIVCTEGCDL